MAKLTNVVQRGEIYHFRMNVPKDLQGHYNGKVAHTGTLETKDPLVASKKADALTKRYKQEHRVLREARKVTKVSEVKKETFRSPEAYLDEMKSAVVRWQCAFDVPPLNGTTRRVSILRV